jgi:hypothetical protein
VRHHASCLPRETGAEVAVVRTGQIFDFVGTLIGRWSAPGRVNSSMHSFEDSIDIKVASQRV